MAGRKQVISTRYLSAETKIQAKVFAPGFLHNKIFESCLTAALNKASHEVFTAGEVVSNFLLLCDIPLSQYQQSGESLSHSFCKFM